MTAKMHSQASIDPNTYNEDYGAALDQPKNAAYNRPGLGLSTSPTGYGSSGLVARLQTQSPAKYLPYVGFWQSTLPGLKVRYVTSVYEVRPESSSVLV